MLIYILLSLLIIFFVYATIKLNKKTKIPGTHKGKHY